PLIFPDLSSEDDSFLRVSAGTFDKTACIADTFGCDEYAFRIQSVEQIAESLALFADQTFGRHLEIVEEYLRRRMIHHGANRLYCHSMTSGSSNVHDKNGQSFAAFLHLLDRGGSGNQQHQIRMLGTRDPDLLA